MGPLFVSTANHTPPIPHLSCLLAISYPYEFQLGAGKVIKGWEVALKTMNVGDSVELVLGPAYAYGEAGSPGATKAETIPPNATLKFHVDFIAIMEESSKAQDRVEEDKARLAELRAQREDALKQAQAAKVSTSQTSQTNSSISPFFPSFYLINKRVVS